MNLFCIILFLLYFVLLPTIPQFPHSPFRVPYNPHLFIILHWIHITIVLLVAAPIKFFALFYNHNFRPSSCSHGATSSSSSCSCSHRANNDGPKATPKICAIQGNQEEEGRHPPAPPLMMIPTKRRAIENGPTNHHPLQIPHLLLPLSTHHPSFLHCCCCRRTRRRTTLIPKSFLLLSLAHTFISTCPHKSLHVPTWTPVHIPSLSHPLVNSSRLLVENSEYASSTSTTLF